MRPVQVNIAGIDRTAFLKRFNKLAEDKLSPEESGSGDQVELTFTQSIRESASLGAEKVNRLAYQALQSTQDLAIESGLGSFFGLSRPSKSKAFSVMSASFGQPSLISMDEPKDPKLTKAHRKEVYRAEQNLKALKRQGHTFGTDIPSVLASQALREMEEIPEQGLVGFHNTDYTSRPSMPWLGAPSLYALDFGSRVDVAETNQGKQDRLAEILSRVSATETQPGPQSLLYEKSPKTAASDGPKNYYLSGFLDKLSDSTVAFISAHERAHSFRQHSVDAASELLLADQVGRRTLKASSRASSHRKELESDADAFKTVVTAGYDPRDALVFFKALGHKSSNSHPSSQKRFEAGVKVLNGLGVELSSEDHRYIEQEAKVLRKTLKTAKSDGSF